MLSEQQKRRKHCRAIGRDAGRAMRLALPLIGAQLLHMSNGLVDTLVAGRLGRDELAAGGLGGGIWFFISLGCIGLMAGLSPTLSNMIGASRRAAVGAQFRQGLWFAVVVGCIAFGLVRLCMATLEHWGIDPVLPPLVRQYLSSAGWSLPAFALLMVCRNLYEATGVATPVLIIQVIGVGVNLMCNLAFGLGWWGFPKWGLYGIGLATSAVAVVMALLLLLWLNSSRFQRYRLFEQFDWPNVRVIGGMLALSLPIYIGMIFEAGIFFYTNIQMAVLGTLEAAAHNVAITVAALCYMLPLGLSLALTARIGRAYGRGSIPLIKRRILSGFALTIMLTSITVVFLLTSRHWVGTFYTDDADVLTLIATLMIFAALFQYSDGAQVVLLGLLRGLQDTRVPMLINAFAYWVVAAPLGYILTHHTKLGAPGLWVGLIVGLSLASLLLAVRLKGQLKRKITAI